MGSLKRKRETQKEDEPGLVQKERSLSIPECEWVRGRMLGKGGFGSVYLATAKKPKLGSEGLPAIMAVKSRRVSKSPELLMERTLLKIFGDCPFVIDCYRSDITADAENKCTYNVFMEYADGGTMRDLIKKSRGCGLLEPQVRKYTGCLLKGLQYIHVRGCVHCDLKPENILLVSNSDGDFVPKIGDFGLAKFAVYKKRSRKEPACQGTAIYLSPEAVLYGSQEKPSDIWALGCVVLEMLTGRWPWDLEAGATLQDLQLLIASKVPTVPGWLSEDAKDFLRKCFVRNPSERLEAAKLLNHPFVTRLDGLGEVKVEPLKKQVPAAPSSENCEKAEGSKPGDAEEILPLAVLYPGDSKPVILPTTVCPKPSNFAVTGAA
ncbi:unnamed protein product [Prunus brigantina]